MPSGIPRKRAAPGITETKVRRMRDISPERRADRDSEGDVVLKPGKPRPRHFGVLDNNEIETPDNVMLELRAEFGTMFDPCPFVGRGKLPDFDGLSVAWQRTNYINPPYNEIEPWFQKAIREAQEHQCVSVFLVPARTGTRYWERTVYRHARELRFITGKVVFKGYTTPPAHNLAVIVFGPPRNGFSSYPDGPLSCSPADGTFFDGLFRTVVQSATSPLDAAYTQRPYLKPLSERANAWRRLFLTADELFSGLDVNALAPATQQAVCWPFFCWILLYEWHNLTPAQQAARVALFAQHDQADDEDSPEEQAFVIPELLRRCRPKLLTCPELLAQVVQESGLREPAVMQNTELVLTARSFYEAYCYTVTLHSLRRQRAVFLKESFDGDFVQTITPL